VPLPARSKILSLISPAYSSKEHTMKKALALIAIAAAFHTAFAQEPLKGKGSSANTPGEAPVEKTPVFPEGDVNTYLSTHVIYPLKAKEEGLQGTVWISFIVDSTGFVRDAKVEKGFDPECDAEALRVVRTMPRWKPATISGMTVPVKYTMPVKFTIVEKGKTKKKKKKKD
jgi:TonB family protein